MTRQSAQHPWALCFKPRASARLRLFCLPYSGGGTMIFREWPDGLPQDVDLWAVKLPGRERRFAEPAIPSISELADRTIAGLGALLDGPYAIFGHSMGALLGFEMARRLRSHPPVKLIASGHSAPQIPREREAPRYDLPHDQFIQELVRLEGTPAEVLENRELLEILLPALRADFQAAETYTYAPGPPLACPIAAYGGSGDAEVSVEQVEAWREQTSGGFVMRIFSGGHFFLHERRAELLEQLGRDLA